MELRSSLSRRSFLGLSAGTLAGALALRLGREPTRAEIAQEFGYRVWLGLRDGSQVVAGSVRTRLGRRAARRPRGGSS